jgi:hypothetical protein
MEIKWTVTSIISLAVILLLLLILAFVRQFLD